MSESTMGQVKTDDSISRLAAYDTLTEYYHLRTETQHEALREALSRVPTIEPKKVVEDYCRPRNLMVAAAEDLHQLEKPNHGEWIKDGDAFSLYKCTACNSLCTVAGWANGIPEEQMYKAFKYCPNCGAKMEGAKNDYSGVSRYDNITAGKEPGERRNT